MGGAVVILVIIEIHRLPRPVSDHLKWLNSWQTTTRGGSLKAWKTPFSRPILIYFELRGKPSLIAVIWKDPHLPKKLIATKYCFLILGDDTSFFFFLIFHFYVVMLCYFIYFVIIIFGKNCFLFILFIIIYYYNYLLINCFFIKKNNNFFMFRDVPCSGF